MLNNAGFDLWANTYNESVEKSDNENSYPFAGYKKLLNKVFNIVMTNKKSTVLDIGLGTGILSSELYKNGYKIIGIDFSDEMINICKRKCQWQI